MNVTADDILKAFMTLATAGILSLLWKGIVYLSHISKNIGEMTQWMKMTEKDVSDHGRLLQQQGLSIAKIEGRLGTDGNEKLK